jgi:hypothetical protein
MATPKIPNKGFLLRFRNRNSVPRLRSPVSGREVVALDVREKLAPSGQGMVFSLDIPLL